MAVKLARVLVVAVVAAGVGAPCVAGKGDSKPSGKEGATSESPPSRQPQPKADKDDDAHKYVPATPEQIEANHKLATQWYEQAKRDITSSMHLVESPHFLIFSAWPRTNDARLREVCETMYSALCRQFTISRTQNVWAGKMPVYVLGNKQQFTRFTKEVDKRDLADAGGYHCQYADGFCYLVLNQVYTKVQFYGLLVHEGTHAFLGRYLSNRSIVAWLNEGLAEYTAARLVPGCYASRRYVQATAEAVRTGKDVSHVFKRIGMEDFDYGVAQSLVRYLVNRDQKGFIELIRLLKEGTDEAEALQKVYDLTHAQLVEEWHKAARKGLSRSR